MARGNGGGAWLEGMAARDWRSLRAQGSVTVDLVAAHRRAMQAEQVLYDLLQKRGLAERELDACFKAMQAAGSAAERDVETSCRS